MLMRPDIKNRNNAMLRSPRVNSARLRRCAGLISLPLAMLYYSIEKSFGFGGEAARMPPRHIALGDHVRTADRVMAFDVDPEVGARVSIDVALDHRELAVGSGLVRHRQLPGSGECCARNQREGVVRCRAGVRVDGAEVDL